MFLFITVCVTARPLLVRKVKGGSLEQAVGLRMLYKWGTSASVTGTNRPDCPDPEKLGYCVLDSLRDLVSLRFDHSKGDIDGG